MQTFNLELFEVTAPIRHAISTLWSAIPAGCVSMTVEFDEQGAALVSGLRPNNRVVDITLNKAQGAAAGLLLTLVSYQITALGEVCKQYGDEIVQRLYGLLRDNLAAYGLIFGYLAEEPPFSDTVTIARIRTRV